MSPALLRVVWFLPFLAACGTTWKPQDLDGDGYTIAEGDCLEGEGGEDVYPGASEEPYNEVDEDCDGVLSYDADGDGHDAAAYGGDDCWDLPGDPPAGYEAVEGAVQLQAGEVYPGAEDTWYDGIDANCEGDSDFDQDRDGYDLAAYATDPALGDCYDAVDPDCVTYEEGEADCDYPISGAIYVDTELGMVLYAPDQINPGFLDSTDPAAIQADDEVDAWYTDGVDDWYDGTDQNCDGTVDYDYDGDTYPRDEECDDLDPDVYPNDSVLEEWGNCEDENCDGNIADQDGDGWLASGTDVVCPDDILPEDRAYVGDCADDPADTTIGVACNGFADIAPSDINPAEFDTPYDCVDADCGEDDDFDADGDGVPTTAYPDAEGVYGTDCDDDDALIYPGAFDAWYDGTDADCEGNNDYDQDYDGYSDPSDPDATGPTDCDDLDDAINPGELERCVTDGVDDDCSGTDNDPNAVSCDELYEDADGDGHADPTSSECLCYADATYTLDVGDADDCDDTDAAVYPGRTEDCDTAGVDDNCDGNDNNRDAENCDNYYIDADGDTHGTSSTAGRCYCEPEGSYAVLTHDDCLDTDPTAYTGAREACDDVDDDCDGVADDGLTEYYSDDDGDGYGQTGEDPDCSTAGVTNSADCDDTRADVYTGRAESCDNVDNDCDASIDEGLTTYYSDDDGDGYGQTGETPDCSTAGVTNDNDCLDTNAQVYEGAPERCPATYDYDCDGVTNELNATGCTTRYYDGDGDVYGTTASECRCNAAGDYDAANDDDCDDTDRNDHPGGTEVCNLDDEDCDGVVDNGVQVYVDADGDGYGSSADAAGCESGSGYVSNNTDCSDVDEYLYPDGPELCDGQRNDCNIFSGTWNTSYEDEVMSVEDASGAWSAVNVVTDGSSVTTITVADGASYHACPGTFSVRFTAPGVTAHFYGDGVGSTIFDGGAAGPILNMSSGGAVTADGITFQNGAGVSITGSYYGGAIYVNATSAPTAETLQLTNCEVIDSTPGIGSNAYGGGLAVRGKAWVTVSDTVFSGNSSGHAGAIAVIGESGTAATEALLELSDSELSGNSAAYAAGAMGVYLGASAELTDVIVEANTATTNGGGLLVNEGTADITCTGPNIGVFDNTAANHGGGAAVSNNTAASLISTMCDWGNGGTDNTCSGSGCGADVDVATSGSVWSPYSSYGYPSNFTCTGGSGGSCL